MATYKNVQRFTIPGQIIHAAIDWKFNHNLEPTLGSSGLLGPLINILSSSFWALMLSVIQHFFPGSCERSTFWKRTFLLNACIASLLAIFWLFTTAHFSFTPGFHILKLTLNLFSIPITGLLAYMFLENGGTDTSYFISDQILASTLASGFSVTLIFIITILIKLRRERIPEAK